MWVELVSIWRLTVVGQKDCTRPGFEMKSDLSFKGYLFSMLEKIVRSGSGGVHRQAPNLTSGQRGNGEIKRSIVGVKEEEQVWLSMSKDEARK